MPLTLEGSCRCGAVHFEVASHTPHPYQLCYCSICRKTAGGGGFAINIMGDAGTLHVKGKKHIAVFHAEIEDDEGHCETSSGGRHFCKSCGTALWMADPAYPELMHPFASAIDTDLPVPPEKVHLMLRFKASWVVPDVAKGDRTLEIYPEQSIEDWHRSRGLWVE
jgi:hypothetical protein